MKAPKAHGAASEVEIEIHEQHQTAIVTLRGEHDLTTQPRLNEALSRASEQSTVLVDLSECTFADSSLINALIAAHSDITQRHGRLELIIAPQAKAARRIADLTRLGDTIPIHSVRNELSRQARGDAA